MKSRWNKAWLLLAALALQGCGTTMLTSSCDQPKVSNSGLPFVYLVVLPYATQAEASAPHRVAARTLTELAGLEAVRMSAETSDLHVTLLEEGGKGCGIEGVYGAFAGADAALERKLLAPVVFYWGEVFDEGERAVVQSHVRVLWRRDREKTVKVEVPAPMPALFGNETLRFTGHLPYATISFPPRSVPVGDREGSGAAAKAALQGRASPSDEAQPLPVPQRFAIMRRKDNWVMLQGRGETPPVWVSVRTSGEAARSILPELSFAQALAAYISYRAAPNSDAAEDVLRWLAVFRKGYADERDPLLRRPIAMADLIEGALELSRVDGDTAARRRHAGELLERASVQLPASSTVLNLAAISRVADCCATKESAGIIQQRLELARQLDTGDEEIARNLLAWYRFLGTKDAGLSPYPREEVQRRSDFLTELLR